MSETDQLTERDIGLAMKVHSALGPSLLESAYEACLAYDLNKANIPNRTQEELPIHYDGQEIDAASTRYLHP